MQVLSSFLQIPKDSVRFLKILTASSRSLEIRKWKRGTDSIRGQTARAGPQVYGCGYYFLFSSCPAFFMVAPDLALHEFHLSQGFFCMTIHVQIIDKEVYFVLLHGERALCSGGQMGGRGEGVYVFLTSIF